MGKKDKKKGHGAEKTASKTEKKAALKLKKELKAKGEDDIEKLIAEIQEFDRRRNVIEEKVVPPPSPRSSFTLTAHPDREELILFGGELYSGNKTILYNDLFTYNIKKNEWSLVVAPNAPPPRCSHQAVATSQCGGQLWIFGGEFSSPTQSQFYHYKDLWVFHLESKRWEKISASGGPSSRSGHRMVLVKKLLIVFGGFHDTVGKYKYFNDVSIFNLETYKWQKVEILGQAPSPRSGCQMAALNDGRVLIYGGYCKEEVKKDVDKGIVHADMYYLQPEKGDVSGIKWRWTQVKQAGLKPSPRCGFSLATVSNCSKAFLFGGVYDVEEDEEQLNGVFYNEMFCLHMDRGTWHCVEISPKASEKLKKEGESSEEVVNATEENLPSTTTTITDGIFTVTIGPQNVANQSSVKDATDASVTKSDVFVPSKRMNSGIAIKNNSLFLYGGLIEEGSKTTTLADFYSIDLRKFDKWNVIIKQEEGAASFDSDNSSESGDDDEISEEGDDDDEDNDAEEDMDQQ